MNGGPQREFTDAGTGAVERPPSTPSRRGYALAVMVAVLGLVVGGVGLIRGFNELANRVDGFQRFDVPGSRAFRLAAAGDYTIYYEGMGPTVPPIRIVLAQGRQQVPLSKFAGSLTYSVGGHAGVAIATFHINAPDDFVLLSEASVPSGTTQLAVGKGLGGVLAQTLVPGLLIFVSLAAATILAIVTAVRRRRARHQRDPGPPQSVDP